MAEERTYSLLIRLGIILAPILAGCLLWSYHHPPAAVFARKPAAAIPAPATANARNPPELDAERADPVADPDAAAAVATPAISADPAAPDPGASRPIATGSRTTAAPAPVGAAASTAATSPALLGARQQPPPGRERPKARDARKQESASTHRTIEKLDKEIDRKLSICSGC